MLSDLKKAKDALDAVIKKSRVHLYKPIQIAEILFHNRKYPELNIKLTDLETYRNQSKKWRDIVCMQFLGRVSTSSAKFQDNLFEENAIPPHILAILGHENIKHNGIVEAYIYQAFEEKHLQLENALNYCLKSTKDTFDIQDFLNQFWEQPGLKRSLDKIFEIVVYSLFEVLTTAIEIKIDIYYNKENINILNEFSTFTKKELAEDVVTSITSDRIIIVCKSVEENVINSLLTQIGWRSRIQAVVTTDELIIWYEKALKGKYSNILGERIIATLSNEIKTEFPSVGSNDFQEFKKARGYHNLTSKYWSINT
jgi:type II restriction enzyme